MTVEKMEVRHAQDFMRAEGSFDLAGSHRFAGRLTGAIEDLGAYAALLPAALHSSKIGGGVTFDWSGDGTPAAHSGTMQLFAHGLQLPVAPLRLPLDVTLEGTYSPQDIFFRTFKLASDRVSLGGFLCSVENFTELQALTLNLDGVPRISGTLFLPFSFCALAGGPQLSQALDEGQKFDVDLAVDGLDLEQFASALGEHPRDRHALWQGGRLRTPAFAPVDDERATSKSRPVGGNERNQFPEPLCGWPRRSGCEGDFRRLRADDLAGLAAVASGQKPALRPARSRPGRAITPQD